MAAKEAILIKSGHVVDPKNGIDGKADVLIENGKIAGVSEDIGDSKNHRIMEAGGKVVIPGMIDMHVHLRQPGRDDEETILTGSRAALRGGFTSICAMANTDPPVDNQGTVAYILAESKRTGLVNVYPVGALTKGLEGRQMSEIGELKRAGVIALSDDGNPVQDTHLMRRVLEYAGMFNLLVISHCEDLHLSAGGVMNEGYFSTLLGLKGIPASSEGIGVARDIELARMTGVKLHIAHASAAITVNIIRDAKRKGICLSAETCPHYFTLDDGEVCSFNTNLKMNPPLRSKEDVGEVKNGLRDGTIDAIATDHAPHSESEKDVEFDLAPFGIVGLETALGLGIAELVDSRLLTLSQLVEKMSLNPARILGLNKGHLSIGADADVVILDGDAEWVVEKNRLESKSKNTPFIGRKLKGIITDVVVGGKIVMRNGDI
jgi:dihydroorotase